MLCITFAEFRIYMDFCAWDLSVEKNTTAKTKSWDLVNESKRKINLHFLIHSNLFVFVSRWLLPLVSVYVEQNGFTK